MLGALVVVLSVSAVTHRSKERIAGVHVNIKGSGESRFTSDKEILALLVKLNGEKLEGQRIASVDLTRMEKLLEEKKWVQNAELFLDNNSVLQVLIMEYRPVARVFTLKGSSFYLSAGLKKLPVTKEYLDRLPVFSNYPEDLPKAQDSALLEQVKELGMFIGNHSFWMAQIDQVGITSDHTFEMTPKLGDELIVFGTAEDYTEKFNKLLAFYKQVQTRTGWNRYAKIDLQYKNQVVAVKRDAAEWKADSLRSLEMMKQMFEEQLQASDVNPPVQPAINHSKSIEEVPLESAKTPPKKRQPVNSVNPHFEKKQEKPKPEKLVQKKKVEEPVAEKKKIEPLPKEEERVPKAVMPPKEEQDTTNNNNNK